MVVKGVANVRASLRRGAFILAVALLVALQGVSTPSSRPVFVNAVHGAASSLPSSLSYNFQGSWHSLRTFPLASEPTPPLRVYVGQPEGSDYYRYVQDSLAQWSRALETPFAYVIVRDPQHAEIRFHWVDKLSDPGMAGETVSRIQDADVYIKTSNIPAADIHTNILHELGHAFGINGHSPYQSDIMTAVRRWKRGEAYSAPSLTSRDKQALRHLYSANWSEGEDLYRIVSR